MLTKTQTNDGDGDRSEANCAKRPILDARQTKCTSPGGWSTDREEAISKLTEFPFSLCSAGRVLMFIPASENKKLRDSVGIHSCRTERKWFEARLVRQSNYGKFGRLIIWKLMMDWENNSLETKNRENCNCYRSGILVQIRIFRKVGVACNKYC